jgi:hypothetical protein
MTGFFRLYKHMKLPQLLILAMFASRTLAAGDGFAWVKENDVTWHSPGTNENDSMPVGNGDLAANVWTEQNGDLVLLLARPDAWAESGDLLKLGRLRIHLQPNPFAGTNFTQVLQLETASVELRNGASTLRVWVDANRPVLNVAVHLAQPAELRAGVELWRGVQPLAKVPADEKSMGQMNCKADLVFPAETNRLTWCHYNNSSAYPEIMEQQHLGSLLDKFADPLLHRCFGATVSGTGLAAVDGQTLKSTAPRRDFAVSLVALTETNVTSLQGWQNDLQSRVRRVDDVALPAAWQAHQTWWRDFWNRSWIHVTGGADAEKVSQGYAMQRYVIACSSRGAYPVKFNGGLFTVGHDLPPHTRETHANHDPDYRAWGECYWNQNNRLLYWPLLASGDYDLLKPWFAMYLSALPLEADRTWLYYHHHGAFFPETMYFFGLPRMGDFGLNNPSDVMQSRWQRYHIQGSLEVASQMLDYFDHTRDTNFARTAIVPFADAILAYYYYHYPHLDSGEIQIAPAQSLETYQLVAVNPTPDIAGLRSVIPRLLHLPTAAASETQREFWEKMFKALPPIPTGRTTAGGKIPPFGQGDQNGLPTLLPAEIYGKTGNSENPELYVTFPYRLYGVGKPDLQLARNAFAARRSPQDTCWGQDGTEAAVLGLTAEARKAVVSEFTNYGDQRFPWFWKPAHDWIPDLDNGGSGMITLEEMVMQCDGRRILLLPAWPKDWTADFKLHAPEETTVEGHVQAGNLTRLRVLPESRAKDVETW